MNRYLALLALSLLVVGCNQTASQSGTAFVGGERGLDIQFVEGSPPTEAFDAGQRPFDIVMQLKNVGEYDVTREDILLKVSGLSPNDFGVTPQDLVKRAEDDLPKTQKDPNGDNVLDGGIATVTFTNLRYIPVLSGPTTFPIRVDVCYKYGTVAESNLCIKENPLNTRENAVCNVNEEKGVENSGAPVKVTGFREFGKSRDSVGFTFTITHVGKGQIFKRDSDCNAATESIIDENKVFVRVDSRLDGMKCSGLTEGGDNYGYAVLFGGTSGSGLSRTITCTQTLPPRATAFPQLTQIQLEYDYKENINKDIIIKHG